MPAENTTTSASMDVLAPSAELEPGHGRRVIGAGGGAGVHGDAELLDVPDQRGAAGVVELHRHQPRRHLDDVGLQAELDQRVGGLEAEQAAADHDAPRSRSAAASRIASRSSIVR